MSKYLALLAGLLLTTPTLYEDKAVAAVTQLEWVYQRDPKDPAHRVWNVIISDTAVTSASLKLLANFKNLRRLDIVRTEITNVGLRDLTDLKNLQTLSLSGCGVGDAGMKELANFKNLHSLILESTKVTDAGLKDLALLEGQLTARRRSPAFFRKTRSSTPIARLDGVDLLAADILKEQGYDVRALKPGYKALVLKGFVKAKE